MVKEINLEDHSEAKIGLYHRYLSIYLSMLSRSYIKNIELVDFFCGEGIYENNGKGSPIVALECIKNHYFNNGKQCPNISVIFNDSENSEIDIGKLKIDRVKSFAENIFKPDNVNIEYSHIEYQQLLEDVINKSNSLRLDERALYFIDPWGYKEIKPHDIKRLLASGKTEILLFLPIYFMTRFANKARDQEFKGGKALRNFTGDLFGSIDSLPYYESQIHFIQLIQDQFKKYLNMKYVDTFKIERAGNQWFALYFFTNNAKGFLKMLESKWAIDKKGGSAYKQGDKMTLDLFDEFMISKYDEKVLEFLKSSSNITNRDLFHFGLENNFLPTHTKQILDKIKLKYNIQITSLDEKPAKSYYIQDQTRLVNIKII